MFFTKAFWSISEQETIKVGTKREERRREGGGGRGGAELRVRGDCEWVRGREKLTERRRVEEEG